MSSSVPPRSLSFIPFFVADGVLLLTALRIAWGTSGELTGGALVGMIACTCLGSVLMVLPFVLNDGRQRETALAERQRELVDLVNSSTATTSRWGAQWAAAATGLGDAAGLAARNITAAERLPAVFQEKIDEFAHRLDQAELNARARDERASRREEALAARADQAAFVAAALDRTLAGFAGMESELRQRQVALASTLADLPAAVARAERVRDETGALLAATADALKSRFTGLEFALDALTDQLKKAALEIPRTPEVRSEVVAPTSPTSAALAPDQPSKSNVTDETRGTVVCETAIMSVVETNTARQEALPSGSGETIMDPFHIPADGYSALADAMDASRLT